MAEDGGCKMDVMNEWYKASRVLKFVLSNRGLRINAKKCL